MEPIKFKGSNRELKKPASMTDEECISLYVFNDGKQSISCWRPSWREVLSIIFTRRIWLCVLGGRTQPPVWIQAKKEVVLEAQTCRECGCTEGNACVTDSGACHWALPDLCSACRDRIEALAQNCHTCDRSVLLTQEIDGYECELDEEVKFTVYVDNGMHDNCPRWTPSN